MFVINRKFHVAPAYGESDDPIQFGRAGLVSRISIRKHIHVAVEHDLIFVKIEVGMGHIPEERSTGIIRPGEVIPVVKEPTSPCVSRQILIRKMAVMGQTCRYRLLML